MNIHPDFPIPLLITESKEKLNPELEKIEWQAGIAFEAFGVKIGVRINRKEHFYKIFRHFPPVWKKLNNNRVEHLFSLVIAADRNKESRLFQNHKGFDPSKDPDWVISGLEPMFRVVIGEFATRRVFVHAGVIGWKGEAIIFPGRSGKGKSTLIKELIKKGAIYYSDEFAVINNTGLIFPYPKPVSIRESWTENGVQVDYPCEALSAKQGMKPLQLGKIYFLEFKNGGKTVLKKLSLGLAMLEILNHTVSTRNNPKKTLEYLQISLKNAEIYSGTRGEANNFADFLLK
jgi:hypothetical protein